MWTCSGGICSWCRTANSCLHVEPLWNCLTLDSTTTPCNSIVVSGIALAIVAAFCNGTFPAFAKISAVRRAQVPSHIFNLWLCLGILLASAPVAYGTRLRCLSVQGIISGVLFVLSTAASVQSVQAIGVFQATGIWCGTAALVSFVFGAAFEPGTIASLHVAFAGVSCLLAGMLLVASAGQLQQAIAAQLALPTSSSTAGHSALQQPHPASASTAAASAVGAATLQQPLLQTDRTAAAPGAALPSSRATLLTGRHPRYSSLAGVLCAVAAGMFGGLILAPMDFVGRECRGIPYLAGLAAGVVPAAPVVTYCLHWTRTRKVSWCLPLQPTAAALPGIAAGVVWSAAAASCMLAAAVMGLAVAYPIMQSGLLVAGLWGMFFGELYSLRPHLLFWSGGCLLVGGVVLLASSGSRV